MMKPLTRTDDAGPILYRADLLRKAKRYGLGFRDIAQRTRLSGNTVQLAFNGNATKLDTLWKLASFFGIPWIALFDLDRRLTVEADKQFGWNIVSVDVGGLCEMDDQDPATPQAASRTAAIAGVNYASDSLSRHVRPGRVRSGKGTK